MAKGVPKDLLGWGARNILKPGLKPSGFVPLSGKVFVRLRDPLVQIIYLDKRLHGSPRFDVGYSTLPLFLKMDYFHFGFGGHFEFKETPTVESLDRAELSMKNLLTVFESRYREWFDRTVTLEGFLEYLGTRLQSDPSPVRAIAACHAWRGDREKALRVMDELLPTAKLNESARKKVDDFRALLKEEREEEAMKEWRDYSLDALKLRKLMTQ